MGEVTEELWVEHTVPRDITIMQLVPDKTEERAGELRAPGSPQGEVGSTRVAPGPSGPLSIQFSRGRPLGCALLALALAFVLPQLGG